MLETNFKESLGFENKQILRAIIEKRLNNKTKVFHFDDNHGNEIDDILFVERKRFDLEYKMDYIARTSGNVAFELITHTTKDVTCGITFPQKISRTDIRREKIRELIKSNDNRKLSNHLLGKGEETYWLYCISKFDKEKTKTIDDIREYFIFNGAKLGKFVRENYEKFEWIITKTKNEDIWYTISCLVKINDIRVIDESKESKAKGRD